MHDDSTLEDALANLETPACKACGATIHPNRLGGVSPYCDEHKNKTWKNQWSASLVEDHKARGCLVCGLRDPLYLIHLHHVYPGTKKYGVAQMKAMRTEVVMQELAKTIPLCANHHAIWHQESKGDGQYMTVGEMVAHIRRKYRDTLLRIS